MVHNKQGAIYLVLTYFVLLISVLGQEYYDRRYDKYDIDHLMNHTRHMSRFLDCFLDKGPCTPVGRVIKRTLPEMIKSACNKCTPSQKSIARKGFDTFKRHYPEIHAELLIKLDPEDMYYEDFQKAIAIL